jgi:large subunit ribosomal protein L5
MSRMKEKYLKEVSPTLLKERGYKNVMEIPKLKKVSVNIGMGEAITNAKTMDAARADLAAITGQAPVTTRSTKSIANFKLRKGMPVGLKVTLRGERMYEFLDKLMNAVLPRIREFQGVPRAGFDGRGTYNMGFKEQIVFPEIEFEKIDKIRGLQITIVTSAKTDEEGRRLLELLGMPFTKE